MSLHPSPCQEYSLLLPLLLSSSSYSSSLIRIRRLLLLHPSSSSFLLSLLFQVNPFSPYHILLIGYILSEYKDELKDFGGRRRKEEGEGGKRKDEGEERNREEGGGREGREKDGGRRKEGREGGGVKEEDWEEGERGRGRRVKEKGGGGREEEEEEGGGGRRREINEFGLILNVLQKLRRFFAVEEVGLTEALGRVWAVILRKWLSNARIEVKKRLLMESLFEMAKEGKVLMRNCLKVANVFLFEIKQEHEELVETALKLFYPLFLVILAYLYH